VEETAGIETETETPAGDAPAATVDPERAKEIKELIWQLRSSDERKAFAAVQRLSLIGDETAVEPLMRVARNKKGMMRTAALTALGNLEDERAVPVLVSALRSSDVDARRAASGGLGRLGDASAIEPLIRALRDDDGWVRSNARESLQKLTGQNLRDYDAWDRWYREQ
jgi:HEAT repeat protein